MELEKLQTSTDPTLLIWPMGAMIKILYKLLNADVYQDFFVSLSKFHEYCIEFSPQLFCYIANKRTNKCQQTYTYVFVVC